MADTHPTHVVGPLLEVPSRGNPVISFGRTIQPNGRDELATEFTHPGPETLDLIWETTLYFLNALGEIALIYALIHYDFVTGDDPSQCYLRCTQGLELTDGTTKRFEYLLPLEPDAAEADGDWLKQLVPIFIFDTLTITEPWLKDHLTSEPGLAELLDGFEIAPEIEGPLFP